MLSRASGLILIACIRGNIDAQTIVLYDLIRELAAIR